MSKRVDKDGSRKKLPENLSVHSVPFDSKTNQWYTNFSYNVGKYDKDNLITVYFSSSLGLLYDIVDRDTIYQAGYDDMSLLKKCLDADGVRYK